MWRLTKAMVEIKSEHWTKDEIRVGVKSWFWVRVELMVWHLSWLDCLKFSGCGFKSHSGQLFIATFRNALVVNTVCLKINVLVSLIISLEFQKMHVRMTIKLKLNLQKSPKKLFLYWDFYQNDIRKNWQCIKFPKSWHNNLNLACDFLILKSCV